jgi:putative flavoprotein involved in K+ transport
MADSIETIIVGGGQAGLALSYYLSRQGRSHVILEQAQRPAVAWREHRWDSFTLVTPNWQIRMPGAEYQGDDPDGFMPRDEVVRYFEDYISRFELPIRYGVRVTSVERAADGYRVQAGEHTLDAANVVVATGLFQVPKVPACSANLPASVLQLTADHYRNPQALPAGAVLVVGTGQSGCQIAEELCRSGRKVYLCVGSTGRAPRRYRGKDITWWLSETGFFARTADKLPSPEARFVGGPHVSGTRGGHNLNLHQFARDGVVLLGHLQDIRENRVWLAPDLKENLAKSDRYAADLLRTIDAYIAQNGLDAPEETVPELRDGYEVEEIRKLDVTQIGITSVIWAAGFKPDFSLVRLLVLDGDGFPIQERGVTAFPGLYFLGMPWLHTFQSGLLLGVGDDAAYLASVIAGRVTRA